MAKKTGKDKRDSAAWHEACDALLKEALARPGIKEVLELHAKVQKQYQEYQEYSSFLEVPRRYTSSDRLGSD